jgi:hypothetical protein
MSALNRSTRHRLQRLPQVPATWEGDRLVLPARIANWEQPPECILWADPLQETILSSDLVSAEVGPEAMVRALLQAMEHPMDRSPPVRPVKVVVRDRQMQLFLRGALQDLDIQVAYAERLPMVDAAFASLTESLHPGPPPLPAPFVEPLQQKAMELWRAALWQSLADHQIVSIELPQATTFYVSVLGLLGVEYGVLLYRSLDSLKRFRAQITQTRTLEQKKEAYLQQDCIFLTFDPVDDEQEEKRVDLATLPLSQIEPTFGQLHPLEGMRPFLDEEEALHVLVALEALHRFWQQHRRKFARGRFPSTSSTYTIDVGFEPPVPVTVTTLPTLADELYTMVPPPTPSGNELQSPLDVLGAELVPEDCIYSLGRVSWALVESLHTLGHCYQQQEALATLGDGLPTVMLQTSGPKAKALIAKLRQAGGVQGIGFSPGEDAFLGKSYDLGVLRTEDKQMHIFGEFEADTPQHVQARKKWDQRCRKTKGYCGLIVAKGATGAARGNPQLGDMLALFEVRVLSSKELGLGTVLLMPQP